MAKFNVTGLEERIRELDRMGQATGPVADAMLTVAGKLVAEGWQYSVLQHGHFDTGALFGSIKPSRPRTKGGIREITVSPRGTDSKDRTPVRNAEKGFVLNYGRRNMAGSHWAEDATEMSEGPAIEAMENLFDDWIWTGNVPDSGGDWADQITWVSS